MLEKGVKTHTETAGECLTAVLGKLDVIACWTLKQDHFVKEAIQNTPKSLMQRPGNLKLWEVSVGEYVKIKTGAIAFFLNRTGVAQGIIAKTDKYGCVETLNLSSQ